MSAAPSDGLALWVATGPDLPLPAGGRTHERFCRLAGVAGTDLSLGRVAEGHADALAILAEAGRAADPGAAYGVWAARSSAGDLAATPTPHGWRITGRKDFCSGAGWIDRGLVTADSPDGPRLFDIDLHQPAVAPVEGSWPAVGMAGSVSLTVAFESVCVPAAAAVGDPGFYTSRIGFWWGAAGVAACWWGGARALLHTVGDHLRTRPAGDIELAAYGSAVARSQSMAETLAWAAGRIDRHPSDPARARHTARITREVVHDGAVAILASAAAAGGARPICLDDDQSRRSADLYAYLAQHHVGRDAAALGRELLARPDPGRP
jgi:alkylation response protein AidB-like acyl-CoA dehydrogenase